MLSLLVVVAVLHLGGVVEVGVVFKLEQVYP
jgi:hypothetical protein